MLSIVHRVVRLIARASYGRSISAATADLLRYERFVGIADLGSTFCTAVDAGWMYSVDEAGKAIQDAARTAIGPNPALATLPTPPLASALAAVVGEIGPEGFEIAEEPEVARNHRLAAEAKNATTTSTLGMLESFSDFPSMHDVEAPWTSRRGRNFYRYWVCVGTNRYGLAHTDKSASSMAATRRFMVEEMTSDRVVNGVTKKGMHIMQVCVCVDNIVGLIHAGPNYVRNAAGIVRASEPTWLEALLGIRPASQGGL